VTEFWERPEIWCSLKHFLKAEVNAKETLEKAYREQGKFSPSGATMRNWLTAVENVEAATGHFEEFATKSYVEAKEAEGEGGKEELLKKYRFYREMTDSTRLVRQKMVNSAGESPESLLESLNMLEQLMDKLLDFMTGEDLGEVLEDKENSAKGD